MSEGIALLDSECRIARCNRAMTRLFGKTYLEIEGQDIQVLLRKELNIDVTPTKPAAFSADVQRGRQWLSVRMDAIRDGDSVCGGILIISDTTERTLAEEACDLPNFCLPRAGRFRSG